MTRDYNIKGGKAVDLSGTEFSVCYRAQGYAKGFNENNSTKKGARSHYHFSNDVGRRFVPQRLDVSTYYYGYNPLAVFVEYERFFRAVSLNQRRPMKFSETELKETEIISFKLEGKLNLFDLNSEFAYARHNLKTDDPILVSTDYSESHRFAEQVYKEGYDGILFKTRQGISKAAVVFDVAEQQISSGVIVDRISALTMLKTVPDACSDIGIQITGMI